MSRETCVGRSGIRVLSRAFRHRRRTAPGWPRRRAGNRRPRLIPHHPADREQSTRARGDRPRGAVRQLPADVEQQERPGGRRQAPRRDRTRDMGGGRDVNQIWWSATGPAHREAVLINHGPEGCRDPGCGYLPDCAGNRAADRASAERKLRAIEDGTIHNCCRPRDDAELARLLAAAGRAP